METYSDQVFARGIIVLERDHPDDFGNTYTPYTVKGIDNFGNLLGFWSFPWLPERSHYYKQGA